MATSTTSRETANAPARGPPLAADLLALIGAMLRELRPASPVRAVALDDDLERDLGLDSLSRLELVGRIDRSFRVRLPEALVAQARTARDLHDALRHAGAAAPPSPAGPPPAALPAADAAPERVATIVEAFRWHLEAHPDREHVTLIDDEGREHVATHADLWSRACAVAAGLADRGVARGERVAIMLPTSTAFFDVFLGVLLAGAVPVPMYPPYRWSQVAEHVRGRAAILANAGATTLVTVPEAALVAHALRAAAPTLRAIVHPDRLRVPGAAPAVARAAADDVALLQYTSGSTGAPKGVVLTHANLLANIRAMGRAAGVTSRDRFASWLPLYHDMGLIGAWLGTMVHAVPLVVMSPAGFLGRPARWLRMIERYRATISAAPNFAYEIAASRIPDEDLEGLDLASWRLAFNGAEPVRAQTLARFAQRFARCGFDAKALMPVYGLAECAVGLAFPPPGRGVRVDRLDADALARDRRAAPAAAATGATLDVVCCGRPLPGHEIRIVDDLGAEVPARIEGRIEFRGPSATGGYHDNPEATRRLRHDGWLDTGDVGYVACGELYVTSRAKDLIKRGGHALHPYDLEEAVGEVAGVRKGCVAVFGAADHATGTERVVVVAETRESEAGSREALRRRIAELCVVHLGSPADEIVLAPPHTVLKTSSGKIRRAACRELYERGLLQAPRPRVAHQVALLSLRAAAGVLRHVLAHLARLGYGIAAWALGLAIAPFAVAALAVLPGAHRRQAFARRAARVALAAARIPLTVDGLDRLPASRPAIVASSHASYADAIVLAAALPIDVHWAAKSELAGAPLVGFVLRRLGTRFVTRDDPLRGIDDTRALVAAVRAGETVGFFPEGTFTRAPGVAPFRLGAFAVAAESGVPVVPVALDGTRSLLRAGRWLPERHAVRVAVGTPIAPPGRDWAAAVRLRDAVRAAVVAMAGEPDLAG